MTATQLQNIPEELRSYPQWVCHDAAKRPINPHTGQLADVTDPTTWGSFDQALAIAEAGKCAGVGFVFTDSDPYAGIDLDVPEGAAPSEGQQRIYDAFKTYAEQSPSGRGLHIIAKGRVSAAAIRDMALTRMVHHGTNVDLDIQLPLAPGETTPNATRAVNRLLGLMVATNRDAFRKAFVDDLDDYYEDKEWIEPEDRIKRTAELEAEVLYLELTEEAAIRDAEANGINILRRADADPRVVLAANSELPK